MDFEVPNPHQRNRSLDLRTTGQPFAFIQQGHYCDWPISKWRAVIGGGFAACLLLTRGNLGEYKRPGLWQKVTIQWWGLINPAVTSQNLKKTGNQKNQVIHWIEIITEERQTYKAVWTFKKGKEATYVSIRTRDTHHQRLGICSKFV